MYVPATGQTKVNVQTINLKRTTENIINSVMMATDSSTLRETV